MSRRSSSCWRRLSRCGCAVSPMNWSAHCSCCAHPRAIGSRVKCCTWTAAGSCVLRSADQRSRFATCIDRPAQAREYERPVTFRFKLGQFLVVLEDGLQYPPPGSSPCIEAFFAGKERRSVGKYIKPLCDAADEFDQRPGHHLEEQIPQLCFEGDALLARFATINALEQSPSLLTQTL